MYGVQITIVKSRTIIIITRRTNRTGFSVRGQVNDDDDDDGGKKKKKTYVHSNATYNISNGIFFLFSFNIGNYA